MKPLGHLSHELLPQTYVDRSPQAVVDETAEG